MLRDYFTCTLHHVNQCISPFCDLCRVRTSGQRVHSVIRASGWWVVVFPVQARERVLGGDLLRSYLHGGFSKLKLVGLSG